ncbi:MAG: lipopolysaccharide kinase InaA family protein [Acidobacteriota bacterium]|nr:lipopolysaccharide kinase InaA family protein [Acidobacteriota bacterium]
MSWSSEAVLTEDLDLGELRGAVTRRYGALDPEEIRRLVDPAAAVRTVHWGRNYLYEASMATPAGDVAVVVKAFRHDGLARRWSARRKGSKAARSWRASLALRDAGVGIAEPVAYLESRPNDGPAFLVTGLVAAALESRYLFRAVIAGTVGETYPDIDVADFLRRLGEMLRRMHDADIWHRDVTVGNVLLTDTGNGQYSGPLYLLDLNRTRVGPSLSRSERMRDLARLPLRREPDRVALLSGYFPAGASALQRVLFLLAHHGFHVRIATKARLKELRSSLRGLVAGRGTHPHIPPPDERAATEDKVVWDSLSDQPHLHAGRLAKARIRVGSLGVHVREAGVVLASLPRIQSEYRALKRSLYDQPVELGELGVGLHIDALGLGNTLRLVDELGARRVLVRVHAWEDELGRSQELVAQLAARGVGVVLAVPQNRDMVRDPERWRLALAQIREGFGGNCEAIQIGHAINRSKWGVWNQREYSRLLEVASAELGDAGLPLAGPAIIDFEFHQTALALGWAHPLSFDVVSSLLYVDRRGAPENTQAGMDTVDKVTLLRAIVRASRDGDRPSWITEVNWPLAEGPHSPAGRHVAVDERRQADYLVRYVLMAFASGQVERIYWWQLGAKGYGLVDPSGESIRKRAVFAAFRQLVRRLDGRSTGPLSAGGPRRVYGFERPDGSRWLAAWRADDREEVWRPPEAARRVETALGEEIEPSEKVRLSGTPLYLDL